MDLTIWTIGHSTRPLKTFLELLAHYELEAVADVRRFPGSRRQPQYAQAPLRRRSPSMASPIIGLLRSAAVAGHVRILRISLGATRRFAAMPTTSTARSLPDGLNELLEVAARLRTTLMCAEAVWWRCHRALIADVLCVRGIEVVHILDETHTVVHPYTSPARIVQGRLSYVPAEGKPLAEAQTSEQEAPRSACAARE